jgi:hypothetical protein
MSVVWYSHLAVKLGWGTVRLGMIHRFATRIVALCLPLALLAMNGAQADSPPVYPLDLPITPEEQKALIVEHLSKYGAHEQRDFNHDGSKDRDEHRREDWLYRTQFDLNKDRHLSWVEFLLGVCTVPTQETRDKTPLPEMCAKRAQADFKRLERSRDGLLSFEEVRPLADSIYKKLALCRDGKYRPVC